MKILKVIHGYPPQYSAGSEVYSQMLCAGLADKHQVEVFTRQENPFLPDYSFHKNWDPQDNRIILNVVNLVRERNRDRYIHEHLDKMFSETLNNFNPDIVHFGHLNHLSVSMVHEVKKLDIPIVFTVHDFWLMCPRGQFIQRNSDIPFELCDGQENSKCAKKCYQGSLSGVLNNEKEEELFFTNWIAGRMEEVKKMIPYVDLFIAPSEFLRKKFLDFFQISPHKMLYLDYGFDLTRLQGRIRTDDETLTFGYMGTHIPSKGIQHLIQAFGDVKQKSCLKIWGASNAETSFWLNQTFAQIGQNKDILFMGSYQNKNIIKEVLNHIDVLVVPSLWFENSPLVIHEALEAGIPVVTANMGGMAELIKDGENGFLFESRSVSSLTTVLCKIANNPSCLKKLNVHYLASKDGHIPNMKDHVHQIEQYYKKAISNKYIGKQDVKITRPGPWRITFDTNPDHCNFNCVMCECFSPHSNVKNERVAKGLKKRVMDVQLIRKILEDARGTPLREIIPSTMGEPLLYKDFDKIIDLCHEFNLKLNLTTNGSFPVKGVEKWAHRIIPVASDVKFSWNGATKETHESIMLGSKWHDVRQNLETFLAIRDEYAQKGINKASVTLQLTFLESNLYELEGIVRMAISLGVNRVKGHHLWAHFDQIKGLAMRRNADSIHRWNKIVAKLQDIVNFHHLPNGKKIVLENFDLLAESAIENIAADGVCPFLKKEAWVSAEGVFSPCCAPDEQRKSLGNFGNLNDLSMNDIWNGQPYNELLKNYQSYDLCKGCNMKKRLNNENVA